MARRKKPSTPFGRLRSCTGGFQVCGSVIPILGAPMPRTYLLLWHVACGTGYLGMGVWVWTAGGAPTVTLQVTLFGTTLMHRGTGTTAMGGTAPMHGEYGMVMPPCAFTRWRRMRRAHAEDGMCIAVLLLLFPPISSITNFDRRNARHFPYAVIGLRWLWLERLRPVRPPKVEPERTPPPPTSKEGRAMVNFTWAPGDSDRGERKRRLSICTLDFG